MTLFGIVGSLSIPLWGGANTAERERASALQVAAAQGRRVATTEIRTELEDLADRLPLTWRQLRLLEDVLIVQAEEALESAKAGYVAGTLNALDLLDAEHVLFDAQIAAARSRADYAIGVAELEGAIGTSLEDFFGDPGS